MNSPVDWTNWTPVERATLVFVVRDAQILLILKKRGLGANKINGPGGRLEPGETPLACAIRETQEELCVTPTDLSLAGELFFQFTSGHSIHGFVYRAENCIGEPTETDEAVPIWTPLEAIPYERMWMDDRLWVPLLIERRPFIGRFLFDDDVMIWHEVV